MSDDGQKKSAITIAAMGLDVAGKVAAPIEPTSGLVLWGAGKAVTGLAAVFDWYRGRRVREIKMLLEEAAGENWSDEGFSAWVEAEAQRDEAFFDNVVKTARAYEHRASPVVRSAVAMLFREYHRVGKPADRYFGNCLDFFCDLHEHEFVTLREWVVRVDDMLEPKPGFPEEIEFRAHPERDTFVFEIRNNKGLKSQFTGPDALKSPYLRDVFVSLLEHQLARGMTNLLSEGPYVGLKRDEITRLRGYVAPKG